MLSLLCLFLALSSCSGNGPPASPHYVLGQPYQSGGIWWYPRENHALDETGLAVTYPDTHPPLTTDGEVFGQGAYAAAHPTVQLPAIARLRDLETGRSLLVRINDRGTPTPHRLVQITRRVADLLGMPRDSVARVRLTVLAADSEAAETHVGGVPQMAIQAAPRGSVQSADLAPPPGARQEAGRIVATISASPPATLADAPALHLPETVIQETPRPGRLWVRLDTFQSYQYAVVQRAKLIGLSPHIDSVFDGNSEGFRVMVGPFDSVAQADAALDKAIRGGVLDARIVVE